MHMIIRVQIVISDKKYMTKLVTRLYHDQMLYHNFVMKFILGGKKQGLHRKYMYIVADCFN